MRDDLMGNRMGLLSTAKMDIDDAPTMTPERRLLVAIFRMALKDFLYPESKLSVEHKRTAILYFKYPREDRWGSLGHLCREFHLSAQKLRRDILNPETVEILKEMGIVNRHRRRVDGRGRGETWAES